MSNDDDECDSHVASQSDVTSFLQEQSAKNTGLTSNIDDDNNDRTSLSKTIRTTKNSYLSQSCFASISPKSTLSDDLTELKWLNTFKLKDYLSQNCLKEKLSSTDHDRVNELIQQLKSVQFDQSSELTNDSLAICLFLAFYSKRDDPSETSWSMTIKQCYEYFQSNFKTIVDQRHWKYLLRQTLISFPCFIQKKDETNKTRLLWTIDSYYRPLLLRAYANNVALTSKKTSTELLSNSFNEEKTTKSFSLSTQSIIDRYPPKATIKKAALPRLFERLCEESNLFSNEPQTERKRARSTSLLETQRPLVDGKDPTRLCLSTSSSTWRKKSKKETTSKCFFSVTVDHQENNTSISNNIESTISTPYPSLDHSYTYQNDLKIIDDERDGLSETKSKSNQRRKKSTTSLASSFPSHRARTRMSRRIIEHDLKLLRQAQHSTSKIDRPQPLNLSTNLLQ